jgi:alpha-L-fucosidase
MRYIVLTTKHHDGFALYDTQLSNYSTLKRAAKRDLIRPYVEAVRAAGLKVGFYFSLCDWHHPDYPIEVIPTGAFSRRPDAAIPPGAPESIAADPKRWERYIDFMHARCANYSSTTAGSTFYGSTASGSIPLTNGAPLN